MRSAWTSPIKNESLGADRNATEFETLECGKRVTIKSTDEHALVASQTRYVDGQKYPDTAKSENITRHKGR